MKFLVYSGLMLSFLGVAAAILGQIIGIHGHDIFLVIVEFSLMLVNGYMVRYWIKKIYHHDY